MGVMQSSSLRFAEAARALAEGARSLRLVAPAFRSPPRTPGERSIRRRVDGGVTVAVRYRDRPWGAVLADLVEGVVVANALSGPSADEARTGLWRALEGAGLAVTDPGADVPAEPMSPAGGGTTVKSLARVA